MNTIIAALDLNSGSQPVIEKAREMANALSAELVLATVESLISSAAGATENELQSEVSEEYSEDIHKIHELADNINNQGLNCRAIILEGNPADEIIHLGDKIDASLIVIGTHGHSVLYDTLIGSVTPGVIHHANRPVLLVPLN